MTLKDVTSVEAIRDYQKRRHVYNIDSVHIDALLLNLDAVTAELADMKRWRDAAIEGSRWWSAKASRLSNDFDAVTAERDAYATVVEAARELERMPNPDEQRVWPSSNKVQAVIDAVRALDSGTPVEL